MNNFYTATTPCFTFDHVRKLIVGNELNFKRASVPHTEQYGALMKAMKLHPTYTLSPIPLKKKVAKKQTYKGLTRKFMLSYIKIQPDNDVMLAEFNKMNADQINYPTMKSWFLDLFKGFDVEKARKEIADHRLTDTKSKYKVIKVKTKSMSEPASKGDKE
jgi:hypothetical protein